MDPQGEQPFTENEQSHSSDYEDQDQSEMTIQQSSYVQQSVSETNNNNQQQNQQKIIGCPHYQRKCQVEAPCCKIFYWCKLCHDDLYKGPKANWCKVQRMEFDKVEKVKCELCQEIQQPSQKCVKCSIVFAKYYCNKCKLYQNNPKEWNKIFHCDKCGMCRKGKPQDFKHCDGCGYCVAISNESHKCFQIGQSQCPVCLQVLKYSTQGYVPMKCGHLIHLKCLSQLCKSECNCPICGMAMQNMSKAQIIQIDKLITESPQLPQQLKDKKVSVICNQCLHKTIQVPFHFYGVKCTNCGTYNTKMI